MKNLEIGCGKNPNRELCNVFHDMVKHSEFVSYTCDLNHLPWSLPREEFDLVYSNQVMEHLKVDVKEWMDELWKTLKVDGRAIIRVPHFTNPNFYIDPTHRRWFSEGTLDYFDKTTLRGDLYGKIYWSKSKFWWRKLKEYRIEGDVIFEMQKLPKEPAESPIEEVVLSSKPQSDTRFYTVSFCNPERAARMAARFAKVGIPLTFSPPVGPDDPRIPTDLDRESAHVWAMMWSHLGMLRAFVEEAGDGVKYGVFCEDDVYIRRDLPCLLPVLKGAYESYNLDVLLMGYLQPYPPVEVRLGAPFSPIPAAPQLSFIHYPDDVWGSQMYLVSKAHAQAQLAYYTEDYARRSRDPRSGCAPFTPDWTLTKRGRRALVYPMMAVEEGRPDSVRPGETNYHKDCTAANYNPSIHE